MGFVPMDFHGMKRKELQALCKKHNIPANLTNAEMAHRLLALSAGEEKIEISKRTILKSLDEKGSENESHADNRQPKKVRFSPEDQMIEYEKSEVKGLEVKGRGRRKSVTNGENIVESISGVIERKGGKRAVNDDNLQKKLALIIDNVASDDNGYGDHRVVTRRSLRYKKVKDEKVKGMDMKGLRRSLRGRKLEENVGDDEVEMRERDDEFVNSMPEKVVRRSKRNVGHAEDYKFLTGRGSDTEVVERGRSRRTITTTNTGDLEGKSDITIVGKESLPSGENMRRSRRHGLRHEAAVILDNFVGQTIGNQEASKQRRGSVNVHEKESAVVDDTFIQGPVRRSLRNANRSDKAETEPVGGKPPQKDKERSKQLMKKKGVLEEPLKEQERLKEPRVAAKDSDVVTFKEQSSLYVQLTIPEKDPPVGEYIRRSKRNAGKHEPPILVDGVVGDTNVIQAARKRRRGPANVQEQSAEVYYTSIAGPVRRSLHNANRNEKAITEPKEEKARQAEKETLVEPQKEKKRSKKPKKESERSMKPSLAAKHSFPNEVTIKEESSFYVQMTITENEGSPTAENMRSSKMHDSRHERSIILDHVVGDTTKDKQEAINQKRGPVNIQEESAEVDTLIQGPIHQSLRNANGDEEAEPLEGNAPQEQEESGRSKKPQKENNRLKRPQKMKEISEKPSVEANSFLEDLTVIEQPIDDQPTLYVQLTMTGNAGSTVYQNPNNSEALVDDIRHKGEKPGKDSNQEPDSKVEKLPIHVNSMEEGEHLELMEPSPSEAVELQNDNKESDLETSQFDGKAATAVAARVSMQTNRSEVVGEHVNFSHSEDQAAHFLNGTSVSGGHALTEPGPFEELGDGVGEISVEKFSETDYCALTNQSDSTDVPEETQSREVVSPGEQTLPLTPLLDHFTQDGGSIPAKKKESFEAALIEATGKDIVIPTLPEDAPKRDSFNSKDDMKEMISGADHFAYLPESHDNVELHNDMNNSRITSVQRVKSPCMEKDAFNAEKSNQVCENLDQELTCDEIQRIQEDKLVDEQYNCSERYKQSNVANPSMISPLSMPTDGNLDVAEYSSKPADLLGMFHESILANNQIMESRHTGSESGSLPRPGNAESLEANVMLEGLGVKEDSRFSTEKGDHVFPAYCVQVKEFAKLFATPVALSSSKKKAQLHSHDGKILHDITPMENTLSMPMDEKSCQSHEVFSTNEQGKGVKHKSVLDSSNDTEGERSQSASAGGGAQLTKPNFYIDEKGGLLYIEDLVDTQPFTCKNHHEWEPIDPMNTVNAHNDSIYIVNLSPSFEPACDPLSGDIFMKETEMKVLVESGPEKVQETEVDDEANGEYKVSNEEAQDEQIDGIQLAENDDELEIQNLVDLQHSSGKDFEGLKENDIANIMKFADILLPGIESVNFTLHHDTLTSGAEILALVESGAENAQGTDVDGDADTEYKTSIEHDDEEKEEIHSSEKNAKLDIENLDDSQTSISKHLLGLKESDAAVIKEFSNNLSPSIESASVTLQPDSLINDARMTALLEREEKVQERGDDDDAGKEFKASVEQEDDEEKDRSPALKSAELDIQVAVPDSLICKDFVGSNECGIVDIMEVADNLSPSVETAHDTLVNDAEMVTLVESGVEKAQETDDSDDFGREYKTSKKADGEEKDEIYFTEKNAELDVQDLVDAQSCICKLDQELVDSSHTINFYTDSGSVINLCASIESVPDPLYRETLMNDAEMMALVESGAEKIHQTDLDPAAGVEHMAATEQEHEEKDKIHCKEKNAELNVEELVDPQSSNCNDFLELKKCYFADSIMESSDLKSSKNSSPGTGDAGDTFYADMLPTAATDQEVFMETGTEVEETDVDAGANSASKQSEAFAEQEHNELEVATDLAEAPIKSLLEAPDQEMSSVATKGGIAEEEKQTSTDIFLDEVKELNVQEPASSEPKVDFQCNEYSTPSMDNTGDSLHSDVIAEKGEVNVCASKKINDPANEGPTDTVETDAKSLSDTTKGDGVAALEDDLISRSKKENENEGLPSKLQVLSVVRKNARTVLIHGTPNKVQMTADMKENIASSKLENVGSLTSIRPARKRTALKDLWLK